MVHSHLLLNIMGEVNVVVLGFVLFSDSSHALTKDCPAARV